MTEKTYKAVFSQALSGPNDARWIIVDSKTGEVLDDAQGYGYRSASKAHAAYVYKNLSPEEKKRGRERYETIRKWCKENKSFIGLMDTIAFEIAKGSWGPEDKFNAALVKKMLEENDYKNLPFTAQELLKYWERN